MKAFHFGQNHTVIDFDTHQVLFSYGSVVAYIDKVDIERIYIPVDASKVYFNGFTVQRRIEKWASFDPQTGLERMDKFDLKEIPAKDWKEVVNSFGRK